MTEVDAAQFGGDIDAEFGRQREDVGIVREDLLDGGVQRVLGGDADVLADHAEHGTVQVAGQAVGFEQDDGPVRSVGLRRRHGGGR